MAVMRLLGRADSSNVRKVMWAAEEMGLAIAREDYGGPFGKNDTPDYLAMNPTGLVPTLVDGAATIWESNTIVRYLAATHAPGKVFGGKDAAAAARVSQWMDWQLGTLNPPLHTVFFQIVRLGDKRDEKAVQAATGNVNKLLDGVLAKALPREGFLFGPEVTAADVCIGIMLHRYVSLLGSDALDRRVADYHLALSQRPGFKTHVAIGKP